jgi:ABC-2 type transport system permease protein
MTVYTPVTPSGPVGRFTWAFRDGWTLTRRELGHLRQEPGEIIGALLFPFIMVLLFGYVFGSAIKVPGNNYRQYLMPGLFAITPVTTLIPIAAATAKDLEEGVVDRLRSIPMARIALFLAISACDILVSAISLLIMIGLGLAIGWRAERGLGDAVAAFALVTLLRYALAWAGMFMGLRLSLKTIMATTALFLPVTAVSNCFVPTTGMAAWLRAIADWNPVSACVTACRLLFGVPDAAGDSSWPLQHAIIAVSGWSLLLLLIFIPLTVRSYENR